MCDHKFQAVAGSLLRCSRIGCGVMISLEQVAEFVKVKAIYDDSAMADECGSLKTINLNLEREVEKQKEYIQRLESALGPTKVKRLRK